MKQSTENSYYIVIAAKHGNPCGIGVSESSKKIAILNALFGDPLSVWGGELITNFDITQSEAQELIRSSKRESILGSASWMLDLVVAPNFTSEAYDQLSKRAGRSVISYDIEHNKINDHEYRFINNAFVRQDRYLLDWMFVKTELTKQEKVDLCIALITSHGSFHGGNEVSLAADGKLIGCGGGPSTYLAAETAIQRAKRWHSTQNCVFAADAFFPHTDASQLLVDAGVRIGSAPKGGKQFDNISKLFNKNEVKIFWLPESQRGFIRH